ncbi:MAG: endopeptidase La [Erysipelotrichaceae bacterium]
MSFEYKTTLTLSTVVSRGVIIFPDNEITIEVGRDKSLNAIKYAKDYNNDLVFVLSQQNILIENPVVDDLYNFGTVCKVISAQQMNGYQRVKLLGIDRAVALKLSDTDRSFYADIEIVKDIRGDQLEEIALVRQVAKELEKLASHNNFLPPEIIAKLAKGVSAPLLADQFAQYFALPIEKKQTILNELDINKRLTLVIQEIELEKAISLIEDEINNKVKDRIDENQRDYLLREKMRAIKEELGDVSEKGDEIENLKSYISDNAYPDVIKEKLFEEIKKYETLPQSSGESGVVRNYIDWLVKLPWWQITEDNEDLSIVEQRLNADHYGLDKPKERITEYLAVKQYAKQQKAPIICLVGPPGVGKTSLAMSVARSLDREFVKVSVGGVRDESEIRGHRRTYLGSMPGKIIQGMKKAGVINPVFLIDEIDKMGSDYKGDPASAMLEVLDPEQNSAFQDHFIEENYDLSKVMFICTANYLGDIPYALRDRLEIIQLSSYTELEKVNIALNHLVVKQLNNNGLKKNQFKVTEDGILHLIRYYTREAGVRQLERLLGTLCRKTVVMILKKQKKSVTLNKKLITELLGKVQFEYSKKEKNNQVGVATGLAYTQFGGDVLPIEVTYFDGNGKLIITGQLGDVMKESATIAYGFIKANAKKFNIPNDFFKKNDIQIHVPEGAVPKDGPSAGITITTALISAITKKPILSSVAMTGEVTLRGNVLPIGGLKEKSLAAHRSGISTVLIPKGNEKDLDEVAEVVKNDVRFILVDNMDKVLSEAIR